MGQISDLQKRDALARLLDDSHLEGTDRLRAFLTYIVEEELSGRGADIRGKTIAQDVYGRDTADGVDPENIVRVDARRLRQLLELHYEGSGKHDPIRLCIDTGGYRPRFEAALTSPDMVDPVKARGAWFPVAAFTSGGIIGAVLAAFLIQDEKPVVQEPSPGNLTSVEPYLLQRAAIYEKSPTALQAFNLANQARAMIFPIFDRPRQLLVLSVFERVIELDPDYFGGYAGAAQALATLAVLTPPSEDKDNYAKAAMELANEAVRLAPDQAWSQSAKSWAYFADRDYEAALTLGRRASHLDPDDGAVLDFLGAVALFSGEFEEAVEIADRQSLLDSSNQRFANRNISGAANFHLGDYRKTIERFEEAKQLGDPLSAPSLAYTVAAMSALGRDRDARARLAELERAWPNAPIDEMLRNTHSNAEHADAVVQELIRLGWISPSGRHSTSQ
ncbi:tetratricopeptide repeat protein [Ruegeria arenilitoris]|uniref:tetratricopeptide repeat protein n=1 Tax=Ruegeria arenilitoris TaxID=1173585 RepID=UPI00147C4A40|nr:hypothetical protein [Ruegeria arenilitoris]